jgi:hypothetical protein
MCERVNDTLGFVGLACDGSLIGESYILQRP